MQTISQDLSDVILTETQLRTRVRELGEQISADYGETLGGQKLLMVGMLRGSFIFIADLARSVRLHCEIDFMAASSYGNNAVSSGSVEIKKDIGPIEGQHVLVVEDIVDSGYTMGYILGLLRTRRPASLRLCSLLDKPSRRRVPVPIDYLGFSVPDEFLVGYGLDYAGMYRNLPYIGILKPEVYGGKART